MYISDPSIWIQSQYCGQTGDLKGGCVLSKPNWNIPCVGDRYKKARQVEFREFHGRVWSLLGHFRRESHGLGEQETISHALYNLWFVINTNIFRSVQFFRIHHNLKQTLSITDWYFFFFYYYSLKILFRISWDSLWLDIFNICAPCFLAQWYFLSLCIMLFFIC